MIVAGVDVGAATAKVVILNGESIVSYAIISTGAESANSARKVMDRALAEGGLPLSQIKNIIATGYGRVIVPFANETITELSCHAKGANWLFSSVRTILDMGGQDCKAIRCDETGRLTNFTMNDKCAAGTGRFLELMAKVMDLPLKELGGLSLAAKDKVNINSTCAVFAKSEVAALIRQGKDKRDILAGLHNALSTKVYILLRRVGIKKDFAITGGIGKNIGVVRRVEEMVGLKALIPDEPQIVGALGAALFAQEKIAEQ